MNNLAMEKRRHTRLPVNVKYRLVIDDEAYFGRVNNISRGGVYLATIEPVLPAACVSRQGLLNLNVNDGDWIAAQCEIVYLEYLAQTFFRQGAGVSLLW